VTLTEASGSKRKFGASHVRDHSIIKPSGSKTKLAGNRVRDSNNKTKRSKDKAWSESFA
jgi:hypothetical protein